MRKVELKGLVTNALTGAGAKIIDRTAADQTEYFDYDIQHASLPNGRIKARFFLWELTRDRSVTGRPTGEHKLQLTIGDRRRARQNFPTSAGRQNFLLGYSEEYRLLVGFQIELHKNFGWSKLVACRDGLLVGAKRKGWAAHLRGRLKTGEKELAIAVKPPHLIDWLRFQINNQNLYGLARQSAASVWLAQPQTTTATPVEAIASTAIPRATAQDVVRDDDALGAVEGDIDIQAGTDTVTIHVNIAERIAATNRHNRLVLKINNRIHEAFDKRAFVIDRDLPGHRQTYPGATLQPDLGVKYPVDKKNAYIIIEAKSLPVDVGGQWRQVITGIGELTRYSMIYVERFKTQPTRVLALERLPGDADLHRFLRNLHDNENICVVWPEGKAFRTFGSHREDISWLADLVD